MIVHANLFTLLEPIVEEKIRERQVVLVNRSKEEIVINAKIFSVVVS